MTVWLALAGYAIGASVYLISRGRRSWDAVARAAWTVGCVILIAHVACAYHFYHNWSQAAVYHETARQTADVTGLNWGGGLYINYAVVIGWVIDAACWRRSLDAYRNRPRWLAAAWQGFLFFIIFNATVVFKTGPLRWIGLGLCLWLTFLWLIVNRGKVSWRSDGKPIFNE
ncbi:MAG TPA: hypothetical protein VFV58_02350 [Blastocatellia bacterium]|nr:hypothetical protein [Blastocatellia bacterium]